MMINVKLNQNKLLRFFYATLFLVMVMGWQSCSEPKNRIHQDIDLIEEVDITIRPYGRTIFALDQESLFSELKALQDDYPVFLNGDLSDPRQINQLQAFITDTFLVRINKDCLEQYPDLISVEKKLGNAFGRFHYFFPNEQVPDIYTYVSGYDYEHRIQYYNDNLIIALDMYLGAAYENYKRLGLPLYTLRKFDEGFLIRDCFYNVGQGQIFKREIGDKLLDAMINEGKQLWFVNLMLPDLDEIILFDFTTEQLEWATASETMIWAFLLENEMLYSANSEFRLKWINDAPFTSYFGPDSPSRLGMWIGYKIVNDFMNNNKEVSPEELMQIYDAQRILKESHYKPE